MRTLYILYLDRYHLGDPLFVKRLAREINQGPERACLIVHGSGEKVERTLESKGFFPDRTRGVLDVEEPAQRRLVERAVREANQEIVGALTDEVVSTVGIQGTDRGLLSLAADPDASQADADPDAHPDADGAPAPTVEVGKTGWLEALIKQQVVAVVSSLARTPGGEVREIWSADAVDALAGAMSDAFDPTVVMLSTAGQPGLTDATGTPDEAPVARAADALAEPDAAEYLISAGWTTIVTNPGGLWSEPVEATRLHA